MKLVTQPDEGSAPLIAAIDTSLLQRIVIARLRRSKNAAIASYSKSRIRPRNGRGLVGIIAGNFGASLAFLGCAVRKVVSVNWWKSI